MEIYTIGHSTLTKKEFLALLKQYQISNLADIRRFPSSKKSPHFAKEILQQTLERNGIDYYWLGDLLGGYRRGGYEAYLKSEQFRHGIDVVKRIAAQGRTALMCAEKLWFRCHRQYVADVMLEQGYTVLHIVDDTKVITHKLT